MGGVKPGEIKKLLVLESLPKPINFSGGMDPLTYRRPVHAGTGLGHRAGRGRRLGRDRAAALRAAFFVALDDHDLAVKRMQSLRRSSRAK